MLLSISRQQHYLSQVLPGSGVAVYLLEILPGSECCCLSVGDTTWLRVLLSICWGYYLAQGVAVYLLEILPGSAVYQLEIPNQVLLQQIDSTLRVLLSICWRYYLRSVAVYLLEILPGSECCCLSVGDTTWLQSIAVYLLGTYYLALLSICW